MLYVLICRDKENSTKLRAEVRAEHLAYVAASGGRVKIAGPFLSDDGGAMTGSLLVIEAESRQEAQDFAVRDPYAKAGLFASVEITPWRWIVGAPET